MNCTSRPKVNNERSGRQPRRGRCERAARRAGSSYAAAVTRREERFPHGVVNFSPGGQRGATVAQATGVTRGGRATELYEE